MNEQERQAQCQHCGLRFDEHPTFCPKPASQPAPSPSDVEQAKERVIEFLIHGDADGSQTVSRLLNALIAAVRQEQAAEIDRCKSGAC